MTRWYCSGCGYLNDGANAQCMNCGQTRGETPPKIHRVTPETPDTRSKRKPTVWGGILLIFIGLFISVCSFSAASGPSGGLYIIAFGPVIAGIIQIARALGQQGGESYPHGGPWICMCGKTYADAGEAAMHRFNTGHTGQQKGEA